ncbi:O-antigen ligase family protein, partial [Vibrio cholerae]
RNRLLLTKQQSLVLFFLFSTFSLLLLSSIVSVNAQSSLVLSFAFLFCVVFYVCTCSYTNNVNNPLLDIRRTLYISGSICSIYGILQLILHFMGFEANVNFNAWDVVPRVPFFSSENVHAAFALGVSTFLFADLLIKSDRKTFFVLLLNLSGLVATGTRGAMIAFVITSAILSIIAVVDKKANLKILILFFVTSILLVIKYWDLLFLRFESVGSGSDGTTTVRLEHYEVMFQYFIDRPLLGIGLGGSQSLGFQDIHNILLMILFEGGLLAFVLYISAIIISIFCYFKSINFRVSVSSVVILLFFAGLMLQAMFEPSLYFYHLYLSIALLTIKKEKILV